jgi:hypothetical protein
MARIPDEVIDRLKQEVSLQRLVEARGIVLKRYGADLSACAPFTTITSRRWWSARRIISGTASEPARPAVR